MHFDKLPIEPLLGDAVEGFASMTQHLSRAYSAHATHKRNISEGRVGMSLKSTGWPAWEVVQM